MALYITESGDVINAPTEAAASRQALRQGAGRVLGLADEATKQRRAAAMAVTAPDRIHDRMVHDTPTAAHTSTDYLWEMGLVDEARRRAGY